MRDHSTPINYDLLKQLTQAFGPSGGEEAVAGLIEQTVRPYCDQVSTDNLGNLIVSRDGTGKSIMIAAHMDEIGIMITHIDEQGFLRFATVGGVHVAELPHRRVKFRDGREGVIGVEKLEKQSDLKLSKLYIDIGAANREEASQFVGVGDLGVFCGDFQDEGDKLISKAMDDRVGCFIAIEVLKRTKSPYQLNFVFTVQEEVGTRGAQVAAYSLSPDLAIAVDVTLTGDTPKAHQMDVKLGKGAAIKVYDRSMITSPKVKRWMADVAEQQNIPFQWEILEFGGTDSGAIHLSKGGVPSGVISVPTRYVHSPAEMVDRRDIESAIDLLLALLENPLD